MSRFEFDTDVRGMLALVTLRGELDLAATTELEPEVFRLACKPEIDVIALDLRGLDFLDPSGLQAIVLARDRLEENEQRLVLIRGPQEVQRVFEITRMSERLEFVDAPEHVV